MRRVSNAGWVVIIGFSVFLVLLSLVALEWPDLTAPQEKLCPQGAALKHAGLLERAQVVYRTATAEGEKCEHDSGGAKPPLREVEAQLRTAEKLTAVAAAHSSAHQFKAAVRSYVAALEEHPFEGAARSGLVEELKKPSSESRTGAGEYCAFGAQLVRAGILTQARAFLGKGLEEGKARSSSLARCRATLKSLNRRTAKASAALGAADLRALEDDEEAARKGYAIALAANADLAEARTALEDSINEESRLDAIGSWLDGVPLTLKEALSWLIPLAVGFLLLMVLVWILVREGSARILWVRRLFEWVGKRLTFFHNAAVPEISVEGFEGGDGSGVQGKDFSNLISAAMAEESRKGTPFPFDRVSRGSREDTKFASVVASALSEVSETKLLGGLIQTLSRLFRRRSIILRGRLVSPSDRGLGLLLTMEGNGREVNADDILWERTFDPRPEGDVSIRYLRLVPAATVWARQKLAWAAKLPEEGSTEEWLPDALFQSGLAWQVREDYGRAEALYTAALEKNPDLLPAAHNLAMIEMRRKDFEPARKRLEKLRERLPELRKKLREETRGKAAGKTKLWPLMGTASLYSLILAIVYPEVIAKAPPNDRLEEAVTKSEELVSKLAALLINPGNEFLSEENIRELEEAELPSVALRASLLLRQYPGKRAPAAEEAVRLEPPREIKRDKVATRLGELEPWHLVHGYVEQQRVISRRTKYNLACYYTTLGGYGGHQRDRCFERALKYLEASLVGGELGSWAPRDPALTRLKEASPCAFAKALNSRPIKKWPDADEEKPGEGEKATNGKSAAPSPKPDSLQWLGKNFKRFGEWLAGHTAQ